MEETKVEEKKEPKLVVVKIFEECQQFANDLFAKYAEPEALLFCFNWTVANGETPVGTLVTRNQVSVNTLMTLVSQLNKQEQRILQVLLNDIAKAQEAANVPPEGSK